MVITPDLRPSHWSVFLGKAMVWGHGRQNFDKWNTISTPKFNLEQESIEEFVRRCFQSTFQSPVFCRIFDAMRTSLEMGLLHQHPEVRLQGENTSRPAGVCSFLLRVPLYLVQLHIYQRTFFSKGILRSLDQSKFHWTSYSMDQQIQSGRAGEDTWTKLGWISSSATSPSSPGEVPCRRTWIQDRSLHGLGLSWFVQFVWISYQYLAVSMGDNHKPLICGISETP